MKNYKNYIFDLYGTLIDIRTDEVSLSFWKKVSNEFKKYNKSCDPKELRKLYFNNIDLLLNKDIEKEVDIIDIFKILFEVNGITYNRKTIEEFAIKFRKLSTLHLRKYSNVDKLLSYLNDNNKNVYLLSNAQAVVTNYEMKELKLHHFFKRIYLSSDYGIKKPNKAFLDVLLNENKINIKDTILIGNELNCDIKIANRCNIDSYYIRDRLSSNYKDKKIKPTYKMEGMNMRKLLNEIKASI